VATRPAERILAEWRALERVVEQASDRDDEEAIRGRIDQLRRAYREATGSQPDLEPKPPQQLALPLRYAPRVVAAKRPPSDHETKDPGGLPAGVRSRPRRSLGA
jgi:hypothetical protein